MFAHGSAYVSAYGFGTSLSNVDSTIPSGKLKSLVVGLMLIIMLIMIICFVA